MSRPATDRALLEALYHDALQRLQPGPAVQAALDTLPRTAAPLHVLAIGKASRAMAHAALDWCTMHRVRVTGGVCVTHEDPHEPDGVLRVLTGDHPVPGTCSRAASDAIARHIDTAVHRGDDVLVLLSGGTSALVGAPRDGISPDTYTACCTALLGAGLDIGAMNTVRRRLSRWGGGRLAQALDDAGANTHVLLISDVPGDVLAAVGGGPCIAEPETIAQAHACVDAAAVDDRARRLLHDALDHVDDRPCTFAPVPHVVIGSNRLACGAVVEAAIAREVDATYMTMPIAADAHDAGVAIARSLLGRAAITRGAPLLLTWGGEPTMRVPSGAPAGGRMQALALAAAQVLHEAGEAARGITLLCAGTDGRDGATDAAGAVVDARTWSTIQSAGHDPAQALALRASHAALRDAGAVLPAAPTGTNVNDVVLGLVRPRA